MGKRKCKCYLCGEKMPEKETEVTGYRVSGDRLGQMTTVGGGNAGVLRYVRMCRVGYGCRVPTGRKG